MCKKCRTLCWQSQYLTYCLENCRKKTLLKANLKKIVRRRAISREMEKLLLSTPSSAVSFRASADTRPSLSLGLQVRSFLSSVVLTSGLSSAPLPLLVICWSFRWHSIPPELYLSLPLSTFDTSTSLLSFLHPFLLNTGGGDSHLVVLVLSFSFAYFPFFRSSSIFIPFSFSTCSF